MSGGHWKHQEKKHRRILQFYRGNDAKRHKPRGERSSSSKTKKLAEKRL